MKTPENPFLEDIEEELHGAAQTKTAPRPAPERTPPPAATPSPEPYNPFLDDDDDDFDTPPRATPARAARPKQSAPQSVSTPANTISTPVEKPARAPRASKNTPPRERPKPKMKIDVPALGDETEATSTVKTPPAQPDAAVEKPKSMPYHFTKEYRDSLTPEQKEAYQKKKAAAKQAKKDAYARGERPWETKNSTGKKKKTTSADPTATPAGHKKRENRSAYYRRDITDRDRVIFFFIARFKFTSRKIMAKVLGVKEKTATDRLRGMQEMGMTRSHKTGLGEIWTIPLPPHLSHEVPFVLLIHLTL